MSPPIPWRRLFFGTPGLARHFAAAAQIRRPQESSDRLLKLSNGTFATISTG
jgi:hypothetical protein